MQPDFLKMAVECAEAARDAFDNGHHDSAVNRSYYAMFNAARAWLSSLGRPIDGKPGAVIGEFGLHVVRPGLIEADFGRAFNRALETRSDADYGESRFTGDDVRTMVERAEAFVDRALAALAGRIHTEAAARGPSAREREEFRMRDALVSMLLRSAAGRGLEVPPDVEDRLHAEAGPTDIEILIVGIAEIDDMREAVEEVLHRPRPNG